MRWEGFAAMLVALGGVACGAREFEIKLPECGHPILISLPENHDRTAKWPAVFYYHGLNGRPRTDWVRRHTGPRDWIVVAMAYVQQGNYQITVEALKREIEVLRQVRDRLAASNGLDPERLYVCGLSKGGWMVDHLLQAERSLAGGALLMGGHIVDLPENPKPYRAGKQVFIGIGRRDGNFPFSLRALQFHRRLGATVCMETWDDLGHAVPDAGSPGLREWFALRAGGPLDDEALGDELAEILDLPPVERWWKLVHFRDRPAVAVAESPLGSKVDEALAAVEADPAVAREAELYLEHRKLLAREIVSRTVPKMEQVQHDYLVLVGKAEGSFQQELVELDLARVQGVMEKVGAARAVRPATPQRKEVKPEFPDSKPRVPMNPLVR